MMSMSTEGSLTILLPSNSINLEEEVKFIAKRTFDEGSATIYYHFYIEKCTYPDIVCFEILKMFLKDKTTFDGGLQVRLLSGMPSEYRIDTQDFKFIGRVFFYCESPINNFDLLYKEALKKDFIIHYRGPEYMNDRAKTEKPLAFISHDSRDKEVARRLAVELSKVYCSVWFDEFSLKVGDRLRESIENGLKNCQRCIVLLSPNFLSNTGWTREEFDAVFSREIIHKQDVILPIWLNISSKEIYEYSPSLANRVAITWEEDKIDEIVNKFRASIIKE